MTTATMPNITGMNFQEAIVTLIGLGIVPNDGLVPTKFNPPATVGIFDPWPIKIIRQIGNPVGIVTNQEPSAGSQVTVNNVLGPGSTYTPPITLFVNAPPFGVSDQFTAGAYNS